MQLNILISYNGFIKISHCFKHRFFIKSVNHGIDKTGFV